MIAGLTIPQQIIYFGQRLYNKNMIAANDGNISARTEQDHLWITPSGYCKADLTEEDLLLIDFRARVLRGKHPITTEYAMHRAIYNHRPDVRAVVHAHPVYATAFAVARIALDECVLPEIISTLGMIPLAPYAPPSSDELAETVSHTLRNANACLMANHGVVAVGQTLSEAYYRLERLEHYAHILFTARLLGGEIKLSAEETQRLYTSSNNSSFQPYCRPADISPVLPYNSCPSCQTNASHSQSEHDKISNLVRSVIQQFQESVQ